ncbi:FtsB/FtsL family cell division protein [Jiangella rhizosphaerae]|uniref:Septum formation initiator family protein n=1 Tax=Jiangella rhizosphaerae TaxID=2293569 RepID=A0A418KTB7_9ACTN|nr:septum formation initiator family protein [Jiangella rhizosphaerae]RIQ30048.1 septum formation initiator family protein [Jiangella rhizosphaerae]
MSAVERAYAPVAAPRRPALRSVPLRASRAPRAPFVVLVLLVLGIGLIGLLVLNTALQQGAFELGELQSTTDELRDRQTELADRVAARSAPDALAEQATRMGMVPAEEAPTFLELPGSSSGDDGGAG